MTITEMLGQSGTMTLIGMGIVFSFLIILILAVTAMGKIIHILGMDKDAGAPVKTAGRGPAVAANGAAVTAAISAAVTQYRKDNK
jgi:oxaloacetate decarboxylase gamma subunit